MMTNDALLADDGAISQCKTRLIRNAILVLSLVLAIFGVKGLLAGSMLRILAMGFALIAAVLAYSYNRAGAERAALSLLFGAFWICIVVGVITTGSAHAVTLAWFPILVCLAGLLGGRRHCLVWLVVSVVTVLGLWLVQALGIGLERLEVAENKLLQTRMHVVAQLMVVATIVLSFLDINNRYQQKAVALQAQVRQEARRRLEAEAAALRAERSKAVFLSNMSHEIRTPLNSIIGFSSRLLKRKRLTDAQDEEAATSILRNGKVLLALVNELLELATIESAVLVYSEQPFSLNELARECIIATEASAHSYGLRLQANYQEEVSIRADQARLHQALVSLLYFCISQTREGGVELSVTHATREGVPGARLQLTDTSNGIPEEQLEGLCETHYQVVLSNNRDLPISALTLALASRLISLHGGSVSVSSELGQGNHFDIWLPLAPPQPA